ncbi:uncharacterized protein SPSK_03250 [Sporothrix schenckii 1099-18]|nr:uncharacterized protein SPSK_03250 [Sporothrix schenckii 1099-18]KJR82081.1 hypothetical protein SPSK_03250 [Sporothrix schenckii 1099-18]
MSTPRFVCQHCVRAALLRPARPRRLPRPPMIGQARPYSTTDSPKQPLSETAEKKESSAMSRRLEEATEDALLTGGRAGRRAVEEAGFSEELKNRLFDKIADAEFRTEHSRTIAAAGLDAQTLGSASRTGAGTRGLAAAQHWTGDEAPEDTILRMLDDARKPLPPSLRGKPSIPNPVVVDLRLRRPPSQTPGQRAANARDKATVYAGMGMGDKTRAKDQQNGNGPVDADADEKQRAAFRKELRERFGAGAGAANMPNTFTGLAALANERIEDAIARGQFRDIPRGTNVARDARADNPFIDTTEYIMNKMIQRQEIVPPWIEKQQELVRSARSFRMQLRTDWRRHAARSLASRGGSLQDQMAAAERYAAAEQVHNPRRRDVDKMAVATNHTDDAVMAQAGKRAESATATNAANIAEADAEATPTPTPTPADATVGDLTRPLRDPQWEAAERAYMELAIRDLNALTRSYNLMAPELAKKPYFSLDRELLACFADVAPTLAETIRDRAARPPKPNPDAVSETMGRRVLERFVGEGSTGSVRVYDNKKPHYGLKEMWRDLWKKEKTA